MRISAVGGFVGALCLSVIFGVSLLFAYHYWHELKKPRIGQVKKRKLRKLRRIWSGVAVAAAIIGGGGTACYYFSPMAILIQPEKQYVSIIKNQIDLKAEEAPELNIVLENGSGEVTVRFNNITPRYTELIPEEYLTYSASPDFVIKMTPHKTMTQQWTFHQLILSQEQIDALNANPPRAELFFFAKGEWTDELGVSHQFPFCYQYTARLQAHVAYCRDDIKIW